MEEISRNRVMTLISLAYMGEKCWSCPQRNRFWIAKLYRHKTKNGPVFGICNNCNKTL